MIKAPRLRAHYRVVPIAGEGALLLSESKDTLLRGARFEKVSSLIDGRRTSDEIVKALSGELEAAVVWHTLLQLEKSGYIEESKSDDTKEADAFWLSSGIDPADARERLQSASVRVFADRDIWGDRLKKTLVSFGIDASSYLLNKDAIFADTLSNLDVVLTDDYLSSILLDFDDAARAAHRNWLLVRPIGVEIWVGPFFESGSKLCIRCLRHRLLKRRPTLEMAQNLDSECGAALALGSLPATIEAACLLAATQIARLFVEGRSSAAENLVAFDLINLSSHRHRVCTYHACPTCGERQANGALPVGLKSRKLAFEVDGGFRSVLPDATLRDRKHLVSSLTGIVGTLKPDANTEGLGSVYNADDIMDGEADTLRQLSFRFLFCSAGKGMTDTQARASALGEVLERYSGQLHGTETRRPGTFNELGDEAIHPNAVANYSNRQYEMRAAWNERYGPFHFVPKPFNPDARMEWTPVWSITEERHKLLPTESLYFGRAPVLADEVSGGYFPGCPNGCASGNNLEEAVLQGTLELIERDAVSIWWYNRLRRPSVDIGSFDDPWISGLAKRYGALDRELVVLDLTSDMEIPVFAAVSHRNSGSMDRIVLGFGCHLDARIALQRSLTELAQMLAVDLGGNERAIRELGNGWLENASRSSETYLVPDSDASPRSRDDFHSRGFTDLLDCIDFCRERIEFAGMEMLVLDQTRSDVNMPTVRVIAPGLRHIRARFAPGRLYDIPVKLGWRDSPLSEQEMNPKFFFW